MQDDEITRVLKLCEGTLRGLAAERRLTAEALEAFVKLSATVAAELERRRNPDRRECTRDDDDRRLVVRKARHSRAADRAKGRSRTTDNG